MTTHLCTFSDESMSRARDLCVRSAITKGGIGPNEIHGYNQWDIRVLAHNHPQLFANEKGHGYWSWKPYLIDRLTGLGGFVHGVNDGDVIIYSDAGIEFVNNVNHIIDRMGHEKPQDNIWLFGNNWEHAHWCKRDVVDAILPLDHAMKVFAKPPGAGGTWRGNAIAVDNGSFAWENFGKQVQASVIVFRVSDYARQFVAEWLKWCLFEGGRLIDDSPSRAPNHPEFQEHRHDQAILTTMAYREGINLHYWPATYNDGAFSYEKLPEYAGDDYPVLFHHHRRRDHEWAR
jgi:hypothetical protein